MSKPGTGVEVRATSIRLRFNLDGKEVVKTWKRNGKSVKPTTANIAAAEREAAKIRMALAVGSFRMSDFFEEAASPSESLESWATRWIAGQRIEASTSNGYQSAIRFWVGAKIIEAKRILVLGQMGIADIKHSHIVGALATRPELSGKTVNNYVSVLREVFAMAALDGVIASNPVNTVPRAKYQKPLPDPFSLDEVRSIIAHMRKRYDPRVAAYVQFDFFTGMRTSESVGLRWPSIDFKKGLARVHEVTIRGKHKETTKTNRERDVLLNAESLAALTEMKAHTFLAGEHVFVDPKTSKGWTDERTFRRSYWTPTLKALGIRYRRPYNTRHTYATMLLMAGARPLWVAEQMGHSLEMLLKVYAKWIPGGQDMVELSKVDSFIAGQGSVAKKASGA